MLHRQGMLHIQKMCRPKWFGAMLIDYGPRTKLPFTNQHHITFNRSYSSATMLIIEI
jgi:hypothetical protein